MAGRSGNPQRERLRKRRRRYRRSLKARGLLVRRSWAPEPPAKRPEPVVRLREPAPAEGPGLTQLRGAVMVVGGTAWLVAVLLMTPILL